VAAARRFAREECGNSLDVRYWPKADITYVGQAALLAEAMLGIRFPGSV